MTLELLVAAVGAEALPLAEEMQINSDAIIVSQGLEGDAQEYVFKGHKLQYYSMQEKGVGLNRNTSLSKATGDISLFSDEDIIYDENYERKVLEQFEMYSQADVLLFNVKAMPGRETYHNHKFGRVRWFNCGRYPTYSMAVRTKKVHDKNITFSLLFGGGAKYSNGEDSLFLMSCLRAGLKVYKVPVTIGYEKVRESTWFTGYNTKFFFDRGVLYAHLYGGLAHLMGLRFVISKRKEMCKEIPWKKAYGIIKEGIREGRR
ncbi:MAG: glycosyltransferase [Lachnospiraceae bacterium]|nr:glycosyltransferase [Lachnospiraceae bacterium]